MQHRKIIFYGSVIVFLSVAAAATVPALQKSSPAFNWLFSPSDLYEPLAVTSIDLAKEGQIYQVNFENKYPGLHWFAIQAEKPTSGATGYEGDFILQLEVRRKEELLISELIKGPGSPYWSHKSGFSIHWYRSPDSLPLREPLEVKLSVVRADKVFAEKHGQFNFVVSKLSDE